MNTVGKILVVLNLVFALAAGAFMVLDFATRTNAHNKAEAWERNATVANTTAITVFGQNGNDVISLDEANGVLPKAQLFGGNGDDVLTGGSGDDLLSGQNGNDVLLEAVHQGRHHRLRVHCRDNGTVISSEIEAD